MMAHKKAEHLRRESELRDTFRKQAANCRDLGSPFVGRVCELFAERLKNDGIVAEILFNWPTDNSRWMGVVPLRIVGALRALVLENRSTDLAAVFPPQHFNLNDEQLWTAVDVALVNHADFIVARLDSPPQTNEVSRSAALLPGFLTIASLTGLPLVLSELGASAGLNLLWDRFGYRLGDMSWGDVASSVQLTPDWTGKAPPAVAIDVHDRAGCDLQPLNPESQDDCTRLLSYIWADQVDRIARTNAALAIARSEQILVEKADLLEWLERRLTIKDAGTTHVIYHSIVSLYLDTAKKEMAEAMIRGAGARASDKSPLAWLRLEPDGGESGAALLLSLWPGGKERCIGRADFHGRWVNWIGW